MVSPAYKANAALSESGGDNFAINPYGTAAGKYQFTRETWEGLRENYQQAGLLPFDQGKFDEAQQELAMELLTDESRLAFFSEYQRPPTDAEQYAMHVFGGPAGGAVATADPSEPVFNVLLETYGDVADVNKIFASNPGLLPSRDMTVGDVQAIFSQKMQTGADGAQPDQGGGFGQRVSDALTQAGNATAMMNPPLWAANRVAGGVMDWLNADPSQQQPTGDPLAQPLGPNGELPPLLGEQTVAPPPGIMALQETLPPKPDGAMKSPMASPAFNAGGVMDESGATDGGYLYPWQRPGFGQGLTALGAGLLAGDGWGQGLGVGLAGYQAAMSNEQERLRQAEIDKRDAAQTDAYTEYLRARGIDELATAADRAAPDAGDGAPMPTTPEAIAASRDQLVAPLREAIAEGAIGAGMFEGTMIGRAADRAVLATGVGDTQSAARDVDLRQQLQRRTITAIADVLSAFTPVTEKELAYAEARMPQVSDPPDAWVSWINETMRPWYENAGRPFVPLTVADVMPPEASGGAPSIVSPAAAAPPPSTAGGFKYQVIGQ